MSNNHNIDFAKMGVTLINNIEHKDVRVHSLIKKYSKGRGGSGTIMITEMLYIKMISIVCDRKNGFGDAKFIFAPNINSKESVVEWLCNESSGGVNLKYMLDFASPSTFVTALRILRNAGLIDITSNSKSRGSSKIFLQFPVDKKFLSLTYAYISLKSKFKKGHELEKEIIINKEMDEIRKDFE